MYYKNITNLRKEFKCSGALRERERERERERKREREKGKDENLMYSIEPKSTIKNIIKFKKLRRKFRTIRENRKEL
jgi:hypothetical protein